MEGDKVGGKEVKNCGGLCERGLGGEVEEIGYMGGGLR